MDIVSSSALSSASKASNTKRKIPWPKAPLKKQQQFSLPDTIIYYITKNPSTPKVYLKLAQSCKYFFEKNPILVVSRLYDWGTKLCPYDVHKCDEHDKACCVNCKVRKITNKIWITDELILDPNIMPIIHPKIYRCDKALLKLKYIKIGLKRFKLYASIFNKIDLHAVLITDRDGSTVMVEEIVESIPYVKEISYHLNSEIPSTSSLTMKNILKLKNLNNIQKLCLKSIPEEFPVNDIAEFIKDHKNTRLYLCFTSHISQQYKIQLDALIEMVIASEIPHHFIHYYGQDHEKYKIMEDRYHSVA